MPSAQTAKAQPTVDELIAVLKRTALPTVVCEGDDDLIVYRRLEDQLRHLGVSVLSAGGRENVLQIFNRRSEIPSSVRLAFIADRDTWINTAVPAAYVSPLLCLTSGYSIENDVIADGKLESLLVGAEVSTYKEQLELFLEWYALALSRHLTNPSDPIAYHPKYVLNSKERPSLMALRFGETYPTIMRETLSTKYGTLVRGKSLLLLLLHNLNTRDGLPRYTDKALLEIVAANPGELLTKITNAVASVFAP
ncbi:hypothetical protein [Parvibium lacunae]|uniref:DUF4435 domain-containing protein n=1 Tax=Parvibium lacunae TaxID=1888893 RepID=A0A368L801_9BURK|nr:hypothetical protein [Parvibium lacunae]RCS59783.1 hypothetical protein DU000_03515 [Parvibium lacunae]